MSSLTPQSGQKLTSATAADDSVRSNPEIQNRIEEEMQTLRLLQSMKRSQDALLMQLSDMIRGSLNRLDGLRKQVGYN